MQTAVPESMHRGKTHSWNVAFERRLPLVSVDVAYVGNRGRRAAPLKRQTINVNPVQHLGGGATDRPYFVSHGRQLPSTSTRRIGKSTYNALQIGVTRPLTNGLLLKGHYTYSRSMALGTDYQLPTGGAGSQLGARHRQPAAHHTMSFVYQLPWRSDGTAAASRRR